LAELEEVGGLIKLLLGGMVGDLSFITGFAGEDSIYI
jgi:hypothetical protein